MALMLRANSVVCFLGIENGIFEMPPTFRNKVGKCATVVENAQLGQTSIPIKFDREDTVHWVSPSFLSIKPEDIMED